METTQIDSAKFEEDLKRELGDEIFGAIFNGLWKSGQIIKAEKHERTEHRRATIYIATRDEDGNYGGYAISIGDDLKIERYYGHIAGYHPFFIVTEKGLTGTANIPASDDFLKLYA